MFWQQIFSHLHSCWRRWVIWMTHRCDWEKNINALKTRLEIALNTINTLAWVLADFIFFESDSFHDKVVINLISEACELTYFQEIQFLFHRLYSIQVFYDISVCHTSFILGIGSMGSLLNIILIENRIPKGNWENKQKHVRVSIGACH